MATRDETETAGFQMKLPRGAGAYIIGAVIAGGGVTGFSAYAGAKSSDAQTIAQGEADKVRKECDQKLEQVMARLDVKLTNIEGSVQDIKVRLNFVEQSYRMYPRGTLGALPATP